MASDNKSFDFEKAMTKLEKIVVELESDKITLDKSLTKYEEGVKLYKDCQDFLSMAQKKVTSLNEILES